MYVGKDQNSPILHTDMSGFRQFTNSLSNKVDIVVLVNSGDTGQTALHGLIGALLIDSLWPG